MYVYCSITWKFFQVREYRYRFDYYDLIKKSFLYWYRGLTILQPGWVIWKYWNCPCKFFSLGSWLVSALSTPNGREGYNSTTDLNPNTVTSIPTAPMHPSCKPTSGRQNHKQTPTEIFYVHIILLLINLHTVPTVYIKKNNQNMWWPQKSSGSGPCLFTEVQKIYFFSQNWRYLPKSSVILKEYNIKFLF